MNKTSFLAVLTVAALLVGGSTSTCFAASAHNSQAGANGPSNVDAPTRTASAAHG